MDTFQILFRSNNIWQSRNVAEILGWRSWSGWSACSTTCGGGIQRRRRTCTLSAERCEGDIDQERKCNQFSCRGHHSSFLCTTNSLVIIYLMRPLHGHFGLSILCRSVVRTEVLRNPLCPVMCVWWTSVISKFVISLLGCKGYYIKGTSFCIFLYISIFVHFIGLRFVTPLIKYKKAQLMLAYPRDAKTMKKIPPFRSYNKFQSSRKSGVYSN